MSSKKVIEAISGVGVVVIGRNEGDRLASCLKSILKVTSEVIYVDSGSTDNSRDMAKKLGIEVVELDSTIPFTAARARNTGFERLMMKYPKLEYVQFIDGDCELSGNWLNYALVAFKNNQDAGVVCGRRREVQPGYSIYNQLCDMEWDTPLGEVKACGGDFTTRALLFEKVNGFNPSLIAGEEPELCVRIRQAGWKVLRIDKEMTIHDANINRFSQWWMRNIRSGYAFAEGVYMHGSPPEFHCVRSSSSIWLWGFIIPVLITAAVITDMRLSLLLILYPVQVLRIVYRKNIYKKSSWAYGFFTILGKLPELFGQIKFIMNSVFKQRTNIIEYK